VRATSDIDSQEAPDGHQRSKTALFEMPLTV